MIPYWDLLQDPPSRATHDSPTHPAAVFRVEGPGGALIRTAICLWDHPQALAGEPSPDCWCPPAKTRHQHSSRTQMRTLQGRTRRWSEGTLREGRHRPQALPDVMREDRRMRQGPRNQKTDSSTARVPLDSPLIKK